MSIEIIEELERRVNENNNPVLLKKILVWEILNLTRRNREQPAKSFSETSKRNNEEN